jgi:hypothetical protein
MTPYLVLDERAGTVVRSLDRHLDRHEEHLDLGHGVA